MQERPVVAISNRLPITHTPRGWQLSSGGLVTALRPVMEKRPGVWVGWDGGAADVPGRLEDIDVQLGSVELTRTEVHNYYHGFSNRTIWPLFHDLVRPAQFERSWWRCYETVNERFAEASLKAVAGIDNDPLVWVHDYHLMLVPELLRGRLESPIGFFLHIPWPPPELFSRLPWRAAILRGLLGADMVSFHTDRYRKNFARTCDRVLDDVKVRKDSIVLADGREVLTTAHPISVDAEDFARAATGDDVEQALMRLRAQFRGRKVFLGVDRLDYTKGILERLEAFEILLDEHPDLRQSVCLVQIAVPSRSAVNEYRDLKSRIEQIVGRINGRFTEPGQDVPVHYIHRSVPQHRLVAYYRLADAMLVTPLKDGMNLVAKEYVVCQGAGGDSGALVLSEFTGASLELTEAVACNPFDVEGLALSLKHALEIDPAERKRRMQSMARKVTQNDIHRWVDSELSELASCS